MERGIYSLPLLHARVVISKSNPAEAAKLDAIMRKHIKSPSDFLYLNNIAETTGGITYTQKEINRHRDNALSALAKLPQDPYTEALALLVHALSGKDEPSTFVFPSAIKSCEV
jgi:geranylgeranyl pyrophosphate synthase